MICALNESALLLVLMSASPPIEAAKFFINSSIVSVLRSEPMRLNLDTVATPIIRYGESGLLASEYRAIFAGFLGAKVCLVVATTACLLIKFEARWVVHLGDDVQPLKPTIKAVAIMMEFDVLMLHPLSRVP